MTRGVIYYNRGTKCIVRLFVSLYSLRKHYNGPVSIICVGKQKEWFIKIATKMHVDIVEMPDKNTSSLSMKGSLWRYSPYDLTMFVDADTIILKPIDEYFDLIEENDFVTGNFANWKTTGGTISGRIKKWQSVAPEFIQPAIDFGKAINTGINGWKKGATLLPEWERMCELGNKHECTTRVLDEIACQLLLPHHKCYVADTKWGESIKYGRYNDETIIIHYHGNKHVGDRPQNAIWKTHYNELTRKSWATELLSPNGDRALRGYLKSMPRRNITLVTAVNNKYLKKLKSNFPLWQNTENIMEMPCIVFAHKECFSEVVEYLNSYSHVKVIEWEFPIASNNMREEMLSAFVFGVAKFVTTKYWMKLDCDTTPKSNKLVIPSEAFKSVITASKWHYTKVKGDTSGNTKHWLNTLDDWADSLPDFQGTKRLFPDGINERRYRHRRIASFCEIEKTNWTKHLAKMCGNRLPVPSQDTTTWYAAKRLGRKITEFKFRDYLSP